MEEYIPKSALVAEIKRRIESCAKQREDMLNVQCHTLADDASARMGELNCIQDFINTLEVKEVDLEKEIDKWWWGRTWQTYGMMLNPCNIRDFAKHFFELGLSVNNKAEKEVDLEKKATQLSQKYFPDEENIWARPNIEAQRCKSACIEMVEWLKAQKGEL